MRYPASEKLEIIPLVEQSRLPVRRTLERLGVPRAAFYRWYDRHQAGGVCQVNGSARTSTAPPQPITPQARPPRAMR